MLNRKLLSSKLFFLILLVFLAGLANIKYKQWKSQRAIEKEKSQLQQQADSLEKKNRELSESLSYLNSNNYKERIARQQLNLKKAGETVYNFSVTNTPQDNLPTKAESNFKKWWDYFFNNQY